MKTHFSLKSIISYTTITLILFCLSIPVLYSQETKEPEIIVNSFSPRENNGGVADFSIMFSHSVIDADLLFTELPKEAIKVTPAVAGKARWIARNQIGFFLDGTLAPSVEYTFEIANTDFVLTGQRKFTYQTAPFKIEKAEIGFQYDKELKKAKAVGTITLNYAVSIEGLDEFLSVLTGRGDKIDYNFQNQSPITKTVLIDIDDIVPLLEGRFLQVHIDKGFMCVGTNIGLEAPSVAPIQLGQIKELRINQAYTVHRDGKPHIRINFSSPITLEAIEKRISIEPPVQSQIVVNNYSLEIHGDIEFRSNYTVSIQRGIASEDGSILRHNSVHRIEVPDLPRNIRFTDDSFFLPRKGPMTLNLATSNIEEVGFGITKVYLDSLPKLIHQGKLTIEPSLNEEVITPLPLKDILQDKQAGVFKVVVYSDSGRAGYAEKLIVVTDLGIVTKVIGGEQWVWVNSLDTLDPIPQARVQLINQRNKETLLTGETDAAGFVKFTTPPGGFKNNPQFLLTAAKDEDFSLLKLQRNNHISTRGFDINGISYLKDGYEAYLYTERGVYRPGEIVNVVGIVRGQNSEAPESLPIVIKFADRNHVISRDYELKTDKDGACEIQIPLPAHAPTGHYTIRMWYDKKQIGYDSFQVEEYMPDRMKVSVETEKDTYKLGDKVNLEVNAMNLFGSPAVGRKVDVSYSLYQARYNPPEKWESFNFTDSTRTFSHDGVQLEESVTDHDGKATLEFTLPENLKPPSGLSCYLQATVQELGGRAVTDSDWITIYPFPHYVGIKRTESGTVKINEEVTFEYITIDTDGNVADDRTLEVTISAIDNSYWRNRNTSPEVKQLESYTIKSKDEVASFNFTPIAYGVHRVEVEDVEGGAKTSSEFYVSEWGGVPWSKDNPDTLDMTLDKKTYRTGEKAKLTIKPPFPGKLLLTIEREKILSYQTILVDADSTTITIPVQDVFAPNAYLSAILLRSTKSLKKDDPARAYAIIPLKIDAEQYRLNVEIDAPEQIRPNQEIDIDVRVNGGRKGQSYRVSIAAVDEGILQLTGWGTPDPHHRFYQQRALNMISYEFHNAITRDDEFPIKPIESLLDLLNLDIKVVEQAKAKGLREQSYALQRIALDSALAIPVTSEATFGRFAQSRRLGELSSGRINTDTAVRVSSVSLWSGLMTTDTNGHGTVRFKVPQFNGTLRVMAVAFSEEYYGSATEKIKVREPVVLMPTFPRFLSGGDQIRVPVSVFNGTGKEGSFTVKLEATGPVQLMSENGSINHTAIAQGNSIQKQTEIAEDKEGHLYFDVIAHDFVGITTFNLSVSWNGEEIAHAPVHLPVRSAAPPMTKTGRGIVREGESAEFIFPSNLRSDTSEFMVSVSPLPTVQFAGGLRYLVGYPHGCLEQTTSKVFPLLYLSDLARVVEPALAQEGKIDEYIKAGIEKLEGMLLPEHHFAYWQGRSLINNWSSIYASHFLVEARKAGYKVSDNVYNRMLEGLRKQARQGGTINIPNAQSNKYILSRAAYACYVLAAAGDPEKPVMHFLRNNRLSRLHDYSLFHLIGAFALTGDVETALTMIPESADLETTDKRESGRNFDSSIRSQAIMLDVLAEVNEDHPIISELVESLTDAAAKGQRWTNTQENAFAILALGKYLKKQPQQKFTGTMTRNGAKLPNFDSSGRQYMGSDWDGEKIELSVKGKGTCYYYWEAFGISRDSYIEQYGRGMQVSRRYLTPDGSQVKNVFKQGELVIAEITFEALTSDLYNVAVVDMLPAGFEIENSRLATRQDTSELYDQEFTPNYIDIRDDRLIFYTTFQLRKPQKFYYALRAVTEGAFTVPPISAEAMYDPAQSAVSSTGTIQVIK